MVHLRLRAVHMRIQEPTGRIISDYNENRFSNNPPALSFDKVGNRLRKGGKRICMIVSLPKIRAF